MLASRTLLATVFLSAVTIATQFPAIAAPTAAGMAVDIDFGKVSGTSWPWRGTYSCDAGTSASFNVRATQSVPFASAIKTVNVPCPATGRAVSGVLTANWTSGVQANWTATLDSNAPGSVSSQSGTAGHNDLLAVDSVTVNPDHSVTAKGSYECFGSAPLQGRVGASQLQQGGLGLITSGSTAVAMACPSSGPTAFTVKIVGDTVTGHQSGGNVINTRAQIAADGGLLELGLDSEAFPS